MEPEEFTVLSDYDKYEKRWNKLVGEITELKAELKALRQEMKDIMALLQQRQQMSTRQRNMYIRRGIPFHFQPDSTMDTGGKSFMERIFGE